MESGSGRLVLVRLFSYAVSASSVFWIAACLLCIPEIGKHLFVYVCPLVVVADVLVKCLGVYAQILIWEEYPTMPYFLSSKGLIDTSVQCILIGASVVVTLVVAISEAKDRMRGTSYRSINDSLDFTRDPIPQIEYDVTTDTDDIQ